MGIYKTSRGASIDLDKLKLYNEKLITVGNTKTNVRGDIVQGAKVIKTREEIARENYNLSGNNFPKQVKKEPTQPLIEPDDIKMDFVNPYEDITSGINEAELLEQEPLEDKPRGGLADAVSRSKELNDKLANQRKKI